MQRHDSDLTVMSFGDHLEELRWRILRSVIVVASAFLISLFFQHDLIRVLSHPHRQAMGRLAEIAVSADLVRRVDTLREEVDKVADVPGLGRAAFDAAEAARRTGDQFSEIRDRSSPELRPVLDHLAGRVRALEDEARGSARYYRLLTAVEGTRKRLDELRVVEESRDHLDRATPELEELATIVRGWQTEPPPNNVAPVDWAPFDRALVSAGAVQDNLSRLETEDFAGTPLKVLRYTDAFFSHIKACLLLALLVGLPYMIFEGWFFVSGGLYSVERRAVFPFIPVSMFSLAVGVVFGYTVLVPVGLGYLGSYGSTAVIEPNFTLREYLSLIVSLLLGMGVVFQLPLVMLFLSRARLVGTATFRRYRKPCILGGVVLSAMLTPPDVVTQLLMAGPIILLYELGIWVSTIFERRAAVAAEVVGGEAG